MSLDNCDFASFSDEPYEKAVSSEMSGELVSSTVVSEPFSQLREKLRVTAVELSSKSRTAKLWFLYLRYIRTLKKFIFAERTCNWLLHLEATSEMLNLFAAAGHGNYAKSARLYLQKMEELPENHPWLYQHFMEGKHAVTRTGDHWTAVPTDMCVEQELMRKLKSGGGMIDRGFTESVRNMWVLSLTHSARLDSALKDFADLERLLSNENKELGKKRRVLDVKDTTSFYSWLSTRNPFLIEDEKLYSLGTGVVSEWHADVNCERAEELGIFIQSTFDNKTVKQCCVKRSNVLKPLSSLLLTKHETLLSGRKENTQTMFIRLLAIGDRVDSIKTIFAYELTHSPASLFKGGMMRKTQKSTLLKALLPKQEMMESFSTYNITIIDGGALLHRVRWVKNYTFSQVAALYYRYICNHYNNPEIIFDGYKKATTKDQEHLRRCAIPLSSFVSIAPENLIPYTQDRYFSLTKNKEEFVKFLSKYFVDQGVKVTNCSGDADSQIARAAIASATCSTGATAVVADDTDIAVMLLYHYKEEMGDIHLFQPHSNHTWSMKICHRRVVDLKDHLLFTHAWSGCDTTSSIFGKGKAFAVKMLRKSAQLRECSTIITSATSTPT